MTRLGPARRDRWRVSARLFALAVLIVCGASVAHAETRVALVIGNGAYTNVVALHNPVRDATAVAKALRDVGFQTVQVESDLGHDAMLAALRRFETAANDADWALVYFAGHGMEVGGINYLIPVDAKLRSDRDIDEEAVSLAQVQKRLGSARKLRVVILDACRENPFTPKMRQTRSASRSVGRGLATPELPQVGSMVAYAAAPGSLAADGVTASGNSPYAAALVKSLATPNVEINLLFRRVRSEVLQATRLQQEPATYESLPPEQFVFRPSGGDTAGKESNATIAKLEPPQATPNEMTRIAPSAAGETPRGAVERAIAGDPDYARYFDRLRRTFPTDYERIVDKLAAEGIGEERSADILMADAVAAIRRIHGAEAAKASGDALDRIFEMQLQEMRELEKRNPRLCVAFLYGTNGIGFSAFARDHRELVADAAIAGLDAMKDGQRKNLRRDGPSDADFQALDKALAANGLTRPEIEVLLDGKQPDPPISDGRMCQAGQIYLQTMTTMPGQARGRLYGLAVGLMAKN